MLGQMRPWGILLAVLVLLASGDIGRAQEPTTVTVDRIDSGDFPNVVVDLSVVDSLGVPVAGLTSGDFQVFEDGRKVPTGAITVQPEASAPVGLVLAVDLSTEPADLEEIRNGLRAIVEQMRPGDEAVLLSFYDSVQVEQPATGDRASLLAAIDRLQVQGNYTALNRATVEAMNRAELLGPGRKAVLIVTDSVENIGSLPVDDVYSRADQVTTPIYLVAYSPKSLPVDNMEAFGRRIKAKPFVVDTAIAARLRILALTSLFSQGYRLQFLSGLSADAVDHSLSISLTDGDGLARASVAFLAAPSQVDVVLPGLYDGLQTGGLIAIEPQISAPGPVDVVTYLVDGQVVAAFTEAPFSFLWDTTTVVQGSHVLAVRAEDSAGNAGEVFVTLQIVDPMTISAQTTQDRLYVGDDIPVLAEINALHRLTEVDFQVNGVSLAQRNEPPFTFSFSSEGYSAGTHIVTVRAVDETGYAESARFSLTLQPPPPGFLFSQRTWMRILAFAAILLAIVLCILLLRYLAALSMRRRRRGFSLKLANLGNTISAFLVRLDDPTGRLNFRLMQRGILLLGRTVTEWHPLSQEELDNRLAAAVAAGVPSSRQAVPYQPYQQAPGQQTYPVQAINGDAGAVQSGSVQPGGGVQQAATQQRSGISGGLSSVSGSRDKVSGFKRASQAVGGLLQAAAVLLPASLGGRAVQQGAMGFGRAAQQASRVENVQRQASDVGRIGGGGNDAPLTRSQMRDRGLLADGGQAVGAGVSGGNLQGVGKSIQQGEQTLAGAGTDAAVQSSAGSTALAVPGTTYSADANGQTQPVGYVGAASGANGAGYYPTGAPTVQAGQSPAELLPELRFDEQGRAYEEETLRIVDEWIETPRVGPGDTLHLELLIEPRKTHKRRQVPFRISTKSVEGGEHTLQNQDEIVAIDGITWTERVLLPAFVLLLTGLICGLMVLFLLIDFGVIEPISLQDVLAASRELWSRIFRING